MSFVKGRHIISVKRLKKLLDQLPEGSSVEPNAVGNLLVLRRAQPDEDSATGYTAIGYVELGISERVVLD